MRLAFVIILLLLLGAFFIISNENINLNDDNGLNDLGDAYYVWAAGVFDNMVILIGDVIKSDWLPDGSNATVNSSANSSR